MDGKIIIATILMKMIDNKQCTKKTTKVKICHSIG